MTNSYSYGGVKAARFFAYFAFCRQAFEQNFAFLIPLNRLPQPGQAQ